MGVYVVDHQSTFLLLKLNIASETSTSWPIDAGVSERELDGMALIVLDHVWSQSDLSLTTGGGGGTACFTAKNPVGGLLSVSLDLPC